MDNKPVILALAVDSGLLVEYHFIKWSLKIDRAVCSEDAAEWIGPLIENHSTGGTWLLWRSLRVSALSSKIPQH